MKIKKGFVLQKIGDTTIVVSTGELSRSFHGMIELNQTAADIWSGFSEGKSENEVANLLVKEYNITPEKAKADIQKMIAEMKKAGVLEDE